MPAGSAGTGLKVAFYGDDFTGSTDTLATLARAGLRTLLFLRVPSAEELAAAGPLDALGVAGAARSMTPTEMHAELDPVGRFFASLQVPVIHYKTCSTFDSAPHLGSIGTAIALLRQTVPNAFVPIVGGQPNLERYCLFGNLFAAAEIGGPVFRIDRHPTMRKHPVTPMHEADLRVHLAQQGLSDVASIQYTLYARPQSEQDAEVDRVLATCPDAVLFDVAEESHLAAVGRLLWQRANSSRLLAVGPSGLTQALLHHWNEIGGNGAPMQTPAEQRIPPAEGPVFVLAGSLSPVTANQVAAAASYASEPLDVQRLFAGESSYAEAWLGRVTSLLRQGHSVLANTAPSGPNIAAAAALPSASAFARACGSLLARLLQFVPLKRVGIAGGDTSSHAVKALDIWGLTFTGTLAPGVAVCRAWSGDVHLDGMELMLKGGQMGTQDLFERLLRGT